MCDPKLIIVSCVIFAFCESTSIVDNIQKCSLSDGPCQGDMYTKIFKNIGPEGIPEKNIPSVDPYKLQNADIMVMGLLKLTIIEGVVEGFKSCHYDKFHVDARKLVASIDLQCKFIKVDTSYKIESTPVLESLIGGIKIHGEGKKAGVNIDKLHMTLRVPFTFKKLKDSEPHVVLAVDQVSYTFEVLNKLVIHADDLHAGNVDILDVALSIMNQNWKFFMDNFAKYILDKVLHTSIKNVNLILKAIPAKYLLTDEVSSMISA